MIQDSTDRFPGLSSASLVDSFFCRHVMQPLLAPSSFRLPTVAAAELRRTTGQAEKSPSPYMPCRLLRTLRLDRFRSCAIRRAVTGLSAIGHTDRLKPGGPCLDGESPALCTWLGSVGTYWEERRAGASLSMMEGEDHR